MSQSYDDFSRDCKELNEQNKKGTTQSIDYPECRGMTFKEFWNWLPHKIELFDYEEELLQIFKENKKIWIKKSTGLGITEFVIRWIAWRALSSNTMRDKQVDTNVVMITGPRIDLAITVMNRLKALLPDVPKGKETVCVLNGNRIEAFPSHHLASARGLNPQIVFLDEADFFPPGQQQEARMVSERYIAKTDPHILMVSTPNLPGGLYENMEAEEKSIYKRITWNYQVGLNKIYTQEDIRKAKESPSFEREYNLKYGYGIGDIFVDFDEILVEYDTNYLGGSCGTYADPGFGSSKFGRISGEIRDGIIYITEADEFTREAPSNMLDVMETSWQRHKQNCKVDANNTGFIKDLNLRGIPALGIAFGETVPETEGSTTTITLKKKMPITASLIVKRKLVRIHPDFKALIAQMRAVRFDKMGGIDKSESPFDLIDALDMMLYDLQAFDYSAIHLTYDGKIVKDLKTKRSKGLTLKTEKFE